MQTIMINFDRNVCLFHIFIMITDWFSYIKMVGKTTKCISVYKPSIQKLGCFIEVIGFSLYPNVPDSS